MGGWIRKTMTDSPLGPNEGTQSLTRRWVREKGSFTSTDWKCQQSALHPSSLPFIPKPWLWNRFEGGFISPLVFSIPATIIIGEVYENESTSLRNCGDRAIRQFLLKNAPGQQVHNFLLQYISAPIIFAIFQSLPQTNRVWFYVLLISKSNNLDFSC